MNKPKYARKKLFERDPSLNLTITAGDKEIFMLLYHYRFLTSTQLSLMTGRTQKSLSERLKNLFRDEWLDYPPMQFKILGYNHSRVYALADKGAILVHKMIGDPSILRKRWTYLNDSLSIRFPIEHEVAVSNVYGVLHSSCRKIAGLELIDPLEIVQNRPIAPSSKKTGLKYGFSFKVTTTKKFQVIPDGGWGLRISGIKENPFQQYFFLEVDQGTEPLKRTTTKGTDIYKKYQKYIAAHRQKLFSKNFGFKKVRILLIAPNEQRMKAMIELNRQTNKEAPGLFKFSYTDLAINTDHPEDMFKQSWFNAKGEGVDLIS